MVKSIISASFIFAFFTVASAQEFRGLVFGQPLPEDKSFITRSKDNRLATYSRKGDKMSIGDIKIESITYKCFDNKLMEIIIIPAIIGKDKAVSSLIIADELCALLKSKHGDPKRNDVNSSLENYTELSWVDRASDIVLFWNRNDDDTQEGKELYGKYATPFVELHIRDRELYDDLNDYKNEALIKILDDDM